MLFIRKIKKMGKFTSLISTGNHMLGRAIWNKLPGCIFENFEIENFAISKFSKIMRVIYPKNCLSQTCDYWLITQNQQIFVLKLTFFNSGQLQNNSVSAKVSITINRVINKVITYREAFQLTLINP